LNLTALALTSSHAGHEVQSIGVIERLGLTPLVHHVKPSAFERFIAPFGRRNVADIAKTDLIVAAGRQAIAYARSLKTPQNVVCILQDPKCSVKPFDLVWVNNHDKATGANVIKTLTSPHRLNAKRLQDEAMLLPPPKNKVLGVIVGGASKTHEFTVEDAVELGKSLHLLAKSKGYCIYLTPSRRTGEAQIKALQQELQEHFVWDGSGHNPYFGILGLADTLIITDDSTNMLSEGTFTGKPIYAYPIKGGSRKFDIFKQDLLKAGVVREYDGICDDFYYKPLDSTQIIADILKSKLENLKREKF
jgi:uncharacterized protein